MDCKCSHCGRDVTNPHIFVLAGAAFKVCNECAEAAHNHTDDNTMRDTLIPLAETQVAKNIREAKERRAAGIRLWPD